MDRLLQDVRYAFRTLLKTPGFTLTAILALALGIGANTAIFTVVHGVLLSPFPYPESDRLVMLWESKPSRGWSAFNVSPANYLDWKTQTRSFAATTALNQETLIDAGGTEPVSRLALAAGDGFFEVTRTQPAIGRAFVAEDYREGAPKVVILSDALWRSRFGGRSDIVSQPVVLDGEPRTVIGVLPADFRLPLRGEMLVPMPFGADVAKARGAHYLDVMARLLPGVAPEAADKEMKALAARLEAQYPDSNAGWTATVHTLYEDAVGEVRPALLMLSAAVGFVLLIACANVANLLLARGENRRPEIAVRAALGAGRGRLLRQLLTESLLLALLGGATGVLLAYWGVDLLKSVPPAGLPRLESIRLDGAVLGFALLASLLTGALFGAVPAIVGSRASLHATLKEGGRSVSVGAGRRLRAALVAAQVALSLLLLIGAGLQVRSLMRLLDVDPGFDPKGVLSMRVRLPQRRYADGAARAAYCDRSLEALKALPGVVSASAVTAAPMSDDGLIFSIAIEGRQEAPGDHQSAAWFAVSPDYFKTVHVPLLRGRLFGEDDRNGAPRVAVVNESFAKRIFPDEDPIGRRMTMGIDGNSVRTIVGVVGDVRQDGLDQAAMMQMYEPMAQQSWTSMYFLVRTAIPPSDIAAAARQALHNVDPEQPVTGVLPYVDLVGRTTAQRRFSLLLLGIFAGAALLLTAVGLYGVVSYFVSLRTHEIGVRLALGATRGEILALVVRQGMSLTALGLAAGLVGALLMTRLLAGLLFGISATDPLTFAATAAMVTGVTLCATAFPAWRAARVNPGLALRCE
jgi:putative ABC transport system permease protein